MAKNIFNNIQELGRKLKTKKRDNILSLSSKDAISYFLKSENYHSFELPEYFKFDQVLQYVSSTIGDKPFSECIKKDCDFSTLQDVNLDILLNKDGSYAVRPLTLTNPYLYYFLVRELCSPQNWAKLSECFKIFRVPRIFSAAIPIIAEEKEPFHKSSTILNWWNSVEQRSLELSLEYRYMFVTDITNCYGSINPMTINMALGRVGTCFETKENESMADNIRYFLSAMQHGRNIGIPQGSAVFDMIAEIILGYSDLILSEKIKQAGIESPYEVIRYRDDYRIFCNSKEDLEKISYILQQVLEELNFRMNSSKTKISDCIVSDSVKPDKQFYIFNTPITTKKSCDFDSLQKHLFFILMFGRQFKNGGQLKSMLSEFDKRITATLKPKKWKVNIGTEEDPLYSYEEVPGKILENTKVMIAIATQIALENVTVCHYALRVISRLANTIKVKKKRYSLYNLVYKKLCNQPNSTYTQLWLQNMTYQQDMESGNNPYDMRLCKLVSDTRNTIIWNNDWLLSNITEDLPTASIVNRDILKTCGSQIIFREIRAYYEL